MYVGRFAPSPTGPLHFGSLLAAMASYLDARSNRGLWLLRIEDLDTFRQRPGAAENIIRTLSDYGFEWDGDIVYQTSRLQVYQRVLEQLSEHIYPCTCTRKQLIAAVTPGPFGRVYPGHCRHKTGRPSERHALRIRVPDKEIAFVDRTQGKYSQNLANDLGDFIILRSDGVYAYQLAVVIDDEWQNISHIVRGADLLDNTPRQLFLQQALGYRQPQYLHIPMANNAQGQKLSKQTHAAALTTDTLLDNLCAALKFLGQQTPDPKELINTQEFWDRAITHWNPELIPQTLALPEPTLPQRVPPPLRHDR